MKQGRPPMPLNEVKNIRFHFVFSQSQVESMGGRKEVLKFVKESIIKECVKRAQEIK